MLYHVYLLKSLWIRVTEFHLQKLKIWSNSSWEDLVAVETILMLWPFHTLLKGWELLPIRLCCVNTNTCKRIIYRGVLRFCPLVMPSGSMSGGVSGPTSPPHPVAPSRPLRPSRYVPVSAATAFLVGATTLFFCFTWVHTLCWKT